MAPHLEARDLTRSFGPIRAVRGISFTLAGKDLRVELRTRERLAAMGALLAGFPAAEVSASVKLLAAYAIGGLLAGAGLFQFVVEE